MADISDKNDSGVLPVSRREQWRAAAGRWLLGLATIVLYGVAILAAAVFEARTSTLQSFVFSHLAERLDYTVQPGPSDAVRFPTEGPFDRRHGYVRLPDYVRALQADGYAVERQARIAPELERYMDYGGFPPYRIKSPAGLTLLDRDGEPIFAARQPARAYANFSEVPPLVVDTLLFIENRKLLDPSPLVNPAIEWDRLALASAELLARKLSGGGTGAGASTLATQMEKFRHSAEGRTGSVSDKFRQMLSASVRAYMDGPETLAARRRIVVDYLNTTPLAARAGHGEVIGLGDGLWAWFGADFDQVNRLLADGPGQESNFYERAAAYRQVLSLLIAQRRPSGILVADRIALERLVDAHLRLLSAAGIIDPMLRDAALAQRVPFHRAQPDDPYAESVSSRKAASFLRTRLLQHLRMQSLYDLDRLDLTVETPIDKAAQERVTDVLRSLKDRRVLELAGMTAPRLLDRGDPEKVVYSFTLLERGRDRNFLRVQTDSDDRILDINEGTWLDLGSTAKLRTLVEYLRVVAEAYERLRTMPADTVAALSGSGDPLTRWVAGWIQSTAEPGLAALLDAAVRRRYSASPNEQFFTAGGVHRFENFDKTDDHKTLAVGEALQHSVNLVFIRLMRDIVAYHVARVQEETGDLFDRTNPARVGYLRRFADSEGTEFLIRFHERYRGLDGDRILADLAGRTRPTGRRLTVLFRSLRPESDIEALGHFLAERLPAGRPSPALLTQLFERYARERFSLNDRAYLAGLHPLEIWTADYLTQAPGASLEDLLADSVEERQESYAWLFKASQRKAQDTRIRILLERQAFERMARAWRQLGYPFHRLVPSYATSIGSSGDRPGALAELLGIILNDGVRLPVERVGRLRFAEGTPFETVLAPTAPQGETVLPREVAAVARRVLVDTVERGTGRRVSGAFRTLDGEAMVVGGKTGTGDHRYDTVGRGGVRIDSRVVNRTATFAFFIGDRFFGVVSAHVAGPDAGNYRFTSALPTQLLKSLVPTLQPLIARPTETAVGVAPAAGIPIQ